MTHIEQAIKEAVEKGGFARKGTEAPDDYGSIVSWYEGPKHAIRVITDTRSTTNESKPKDDVGDQPLQENKQRI
jgi:hypothetical protein